MHPDKTLSSIFDPRSPSPPLPNSPAPAYSALPYRDVEFFAAPLLDDTVGDVELETVDGKRFLVHRKLLEAETVFFHIYYGFIPTWRLNGGSPPGHNAVPNHPVNQGNGAGNALNNLLCLPKIIANHLTRASTLVNAGLEHENHQSGPPVPPKDFPPRHTQGHVSHVGGGGNHNGPNLPVTAPTPTSSPYSWLVPETSEVLAAFLNLLYPIGTFTLLNSSTPTPSYSPTPTPTSTPTNVQTSTSCLTTIELTGRVIRASLGYQCSKTLTLARDHLITFLPTHSIQVYSLATFFKFNDTAKLASHFAMNIPNSQWPQECLAIMGRNGVNKLTELQTIRLQGLKKILESSLKFYGKFEEHGRNCVRRGMIEDVWRKRCEEIREVVKVDSELLELITMDVRGGHCGECLMVLGENVQRCLEEVKALPRTI